MFFIELHRSPKIIILEFNLIDFRVQSPSKGRIVDTLYDKIGQVASDINKIKRISGMSNAKNTMKN